MPQETADACITTFQTLRKFVQPFITTQPLRLWNRPTAEFFRPEDAAVDRMGSGPSEADRWVPVSREELLAGRARPTERSAEEFDLSRVVVVVDSGRGKTTLLRRLAMQLGQHPDVAVQQTLAVRVEVNQLPPTTDEHWATDEEVLDRLADVLLTGNAKLKRLVASSGDVRLRLRGWLALQRANGRLLLLLDAVDQSRGPQLKTLKRMLTGELPEWKDCRCILTGRPPAIRELNARFLGRQFEQPQNGWRVVELQAFSESDQQDYLGLDRWNKLPPAARVLLETPRVCEYARGLTDAEAATLKTEADVYYGSLRRMLSFGLLTEIAKSFGPGRESGALPGEEVRTAPPAQIDAALQLLSAIAFEMISLPNKDAGNLRNEVTAADSPADFESFLNRVQARVRTASRCQWNDDQKFYQDVRRLDAVNAAQFDFWFFDTHNAERFEEIRFRDATIKEFLAAYWVAKYGTPEDAKQIESWIYLPDRPVGDTDTNPQFAWFWRYLCEMPAGGRSSQSWLSAIAMLYRPNPLGRPCEMMYRAWPTLTKYRDAGNNQTRSIINDFQSEFPAILNGPDVKRARIAAELVPEHELEKLVNDKRRLNAIRPPSDAPAFVRCPPQSVEDAEIEELKRRGEQPDPHLGLKCHRYWRGTDAGPLDRDGDTDWRFDDEMPRHQVRLTPFWFKATHVTRQEFALFDPSHAAAWKKSLDLYAPKLDCPVLYVSWYQSWCLALWCGMALPTEAQFEFGVRAGHDGPDDVFPFAPWDIAWSFQINCDGRYPFAAGGADLGLTVPVRCERPQRNGKPVPDVKYAPNEWGVWHPVGQAWVWCGDWYDAHEYPRCLAAGIAVDPVGPALGTARVLRGGAWNDVPTNCRSAVRLRNTPDDWLDDIGLRLVCVVCVRTP